MFVAVLQTFAGVDKYVEALLEVRKGKNLTRDTAIDAVTGDVNMFGVMMVAMGDAGGMVSGSIHTTAATIRPAMQVLKTPNLVSSVFFMCLPDKVRGLCVCLCDGCKERSRVAAAAGALSAYAVFACAAATGAFFALQPACPGPRC